MIGWYYWSAVPFTAERPWLFDRTSSFFYFVLTLLSLMFGDVLNLKIKVIILLLRKTKPDMVTVFGTNFTWYKFHKLVKSHVIFLGSNLLISLCFKRLQTFSLVMLEVPGQVPVSWKLTLNISVCNWEGAQAMMSAPGFKTLGAESSKSKTGLTKW